MKKWMFVAIAWLFLSGLTPFTLQNFALTVTAPSPRVSLSINGSSTPGQVLPAGGTMTVAATGGPGNQNDGLYVCDHADGCAPTAGMDYTYLNCTKNPPASAPYPTATPPSGCTMAVPAANASYYLLFLQSVPPATNLAQLDFTVGAAAPTISGLSVAPNSVVQGAAFSGTLTTSCSTTCPGASTYSLVVDATRCPAANNAPFSLSGSTLSMAAQSATGTQTACVRVAMTNAANTPADFPVAVSVTSSAPMITVNGSSSGVTVSPGTSMTVAVANGPAAQDDWMGICNAGVTPAQNQCDGAGYDWAWVANCTKTGTLPTSGLAANSCPLVAPSAGGNYVAIFFHTLHYTTPIATASFTVTATTPSITGASVSPNTFSVPSGGTASFSGTLSATCSVSPCPGPATFTLASAPAPAITVNGSSGGASVTAGAAMTVAATNGPGNNNDWMGICTTATPSNPTCDGAGYQWGWMSCTHTLPSIPQTSASCPSWSAPSVAGNYQAVFFWCNYPSNCPNGGYNVLAAAPFTVTGGGGGGGTCTPAGATCPVGVAAPSGFHWNRTFYDDFRTDSSINGSLWTQNNTSGSVITCCDSFYGIRSYPHLDLSNLGYTWTDLTLNYSLRQRYGFFEVGFRWPTDASGEGDGRHIDLNLNVGPGGCGAACSELDISEQELGTGAQYLDNSFLHDCDAPHSSDPACGGQVGTAQWVAWSTPDGLKMSDHNRALGMQWTNDGTAHGTVQVFLDGSAVTGPHSLVSSAFDLGVSWDLFDVACEGSNWGNGSAACNPSTSSPGTNPLSIQYVAMWQLVPN